jgi:hypothetical protein
VKTCPACGAEIAYRGRGRPRTYCESCTPPGSGRAAWSAAWYAANRERLEAERKKAHAARMAQWRANMKRNRETMAANRRALERKAGKVA